MRTNSLLGKGIAFPLRIDPITKDFAISEGNTNDATVELAYMSDAWTARETVPARQNLIAESIAHIVLTHVGEYDTLPKFGSHVINEVFEQNTYEQEIVTRVYFQTAAERWEKRARIPEEGVTWKTSPWDLDEHIAKVGVSVSFIGEQKPGNLVTPETTTPTLFRKAIPGFTLQMTTTMTTDVGGYQLRCMFRIKPKRAQGWLT